MVKECNILTSYKSDHSAIRLCLKLNEFKHGKGLWKFYNSLLYDIDYLEIINQIIKKITRDYALPVFNIENLENIPNAEIKFTVNNQLFLETILLEIRVKTISYASYKKKKRIWKKKTLKDEIFKIEENYECNQEGLKDKKKELEDIRS